MLRPRQVEAMTAIKDNYLKGIRQQVVSACTGFGKTQLFAHSPDYLKDILPGQMVVLAHRDELLNHSIEKIHNANKHLKISKEKAALWADGESDVIVASVQSLGKNGAERAKRFDWSKIDKIFTDECHHSTGQTYLDIYNIAGIEGSNKLHVGFTATPQRPDGKRLSEVFKKIVFNYPLRKSIEEGWSVDVRGIRVHTKISLDEVKSTAGDLNERQLSDTVNTPERNDLIARTWLEHANGEQTIGFAVSIQHAKDLAETFRNAGIKAEAIWDGDPDRTEKLERHRAKDITVIFNCEILTEGYDDWQVSVIILARPTKSNILFTQMIGRATRLQDGTGNLLDWKGEPIKSSCLIIDVVDSTSRHSLVTLPTLMGLNAGLDLRGQSLVKTVQQIEEAQQEFSFINFSSLTDITQLESYIESVDLFNIKLPEEVEKNSELSWYTSATGGFVLLLPDKQEVHIQQNLLDKYEIFGIMNGKKYRGERDTIEEAFLAADGIVQKVLPEALKVVRQDARWHKDPPTKKQLRKLKQLYKNSPISNNLNMTKGIATKLIGSKLAGKVK